MKTNESKWVAAVFLCAAIALTSDAGVWTVERHSDDMTDAEFYEVFADGDKVVAGSGVEYVPTIRVRMTPDGKRMKPDVYFTIQTDGLKRGRFEGQVRFDTNAVETVTFNSSTERRAGFFTDGIDAVAKMSKARLLRIRFVTTLGAVRTLRFDIAGLIEKLKEVRRLHSVKSIKSESTR